MVRFWPTMYYKRSNKVKWSKKQVAESNGDVRLLIGSSEIAVCANAQYKFGQNSRE